MKSTTTYHPLQNLARNLSRIYRLGEVIKTDIFPEVPYDILHVLRQLKDCGPRTIPQLAQYHYVSRQQMRNTILSLIAQGYVELAENQAHKTSKLVVLTDSGRSLVDTLNTRGQAIAATLEHDYDLEEVDKANALVTRFHNDLERYWVVNKSG